MIRKIGISVILLFVIIFNPVQPEFWRITTFKGPISKPSIAKTRGNSVVGCLVYCSTYYTSVFATTQDGFCYCLTSYPHVNWTGEYVTLTSIMTRLSEPSDCVSKGYEIYPELGTCIKHRSSRKTWLDAERYCNQDGGSLLNVDTQAKFNASIDIINSTNVIWQVYVGGIASFWANNTDYHWTRGGVVDRFWLANEPNYPLEMEPCVSIMNLKGLNNFYCDKVYPFLCELLLF